VAAGRIAGQRAGRAPTRHGHGGQRRTQLQAVRERAARLFAQGRSSSSVATELGVARQTAVRWHASWRTGGAAALRSRGPSRHPAVPDSQLPAIDQALRQGAKAYGFDSDAWTLARIGIVVQRVTGKQLGRNALRQLLHQRLGWSVQRPATRQPAGRRGRPGGKKRPRRRGRLSASVVKDATTPAPPTCC
jgi:transposase